MTSCKDPASTRIRVLVHRDPFSMRDVIVIGGGVIGLTLAYELARRNRDVAVYDQGALGQESSWAGAGIIAPGNPALATTPEARLRAASAALWPTISRQLLE